jgi:hypothetical protein
MPAATKIMPTPLARIGSACCTTKPNKIKLKNIFYIIDF